MMKKLAFAAAAIVLTFAPGMTANAEPTASVASTTTKVASTQPMRSVTWGSCGVTTSESKIIRTYSGVAGIRTVYLKCGGPKYTSSPTWGYRHILRYHRSQFETLAARSTYQNWRDVADAGMVASLIRPQVRGPEQSGKRCFSGTISLYDSNGRLYKRQIIRTVFRTSDRAVITTYPSSAQCETRRD